MDKVELSIVLYNVSVVGNSRHQLVADLTNNFQVDELPLPLDETLSISTSCNPIFQQISLASHGNAFVLEPTLIPAY